jgi:hypothetical protein
MGKVFEHKIINGEEVFYRECYPKHFFIKFNGFGVSKNRLAKLRQKYPQVNKLIIDYFGGQRKTYTSKIDDWLFNANTYTFKGTDEQLILSLDFMDDGRVQDIKVASLTRWL